MNCTKKILIANKFSNDLAKKSDYLFENKNEAVQMEEKAGLEVENVYSAEAHYEKWMEVLQGVENICKM